MYWHLETNNKLGIFETLFDNFEIEILRQSTFKYFDNFEYKDYNILNTFLFLQIFCVRYSFYLYYIVLFFIYIFIKIFVLFNDFYHTYIRICVLYITS